MTETEHSGTVNPDDAESAYQALSESAQVNARRILLRMVILDDALRPRWQSVPQSALANADPARQAALQALTRAGVVTVSSEGGVREPRVSAGDEALLETWPRLRDWISGNRADLLARQQVAAAGAAWHAHGRDGGDLWPGSRMAVASGFADGEGDVELLDSVSREFLAASRERGRGTRGPVLRRRRSILAGVCALLLVALGLWLSNRPSGGAEQNAARSQQLISDAERLSGNPVLAEELALAAYRYSPSAAASDLLYKMFSQPSSSTVDNTGSGILRVSTAAGAPLAAASSGDGSFRIWNLAGKPAPVLDAQVPHARTAGLALSPRGTLLAAGCHAQDLCLWSLADARHPKVEALMPAPGGGKFPGALTSVAFSPDGALVAASSENAKTYLWSVRDPGHPRLLVVLPNPMSYNDPLAAVAFSTRDNLFAETMQGGQTRLWNLKDPSRPVPVATIRTGFQSLQFSPDGSMLAAVGRDQAGLWSLADPGRPRAIDIENACTTGSSGDLLDFQAVAFSPGSDQIAYSGEDVTDKKGTMCVLPLSPADLESGSPTAVSIPTNFPTFSLDYASTGELITGGQDGAVRRWTTPLQQIDGLASVVPGSDFDIGANGRLLAGIIGGPLKGTTQMFYQPVGVGVWDISTQGGPVLDATIPAAAEHVAFLAPHLLLTVNGAGQVRLWDLADPGSPRQGASLGTAVVPKGDGWTFAGEVTSNNAGTAVAVLGPDGLLHLWRVTSPYDAHELSSMPAGRAGLGVAAIQPSGDTALFETPNGVQWWGIRDPARPVRGGFTPLPHASTGEIAAVGHLAVLGTPPANNGAGDNATFDVVDLDNGAVKSTATLTRSASDVAGLSGDDRLAVTTTNDDSTLTLWSVRDPRHPRRLATLAVPRAQNIEFTASGTTMAVENQNSVQLWSLRDPARPVLEGTFTPPVPTVGEQHLLGEQQFTASGTLFLEDLSTVYLVSGNSGSLAERLCSSLGSTISPEQWNEYAPGVPYRNPCPSPGR